MIYTRKQLLSDQEHVLTNANNARSIALYRTVLMVPRKSIIADGIDVIDATHLYWCMIYYTTHEQNNATLCMIVHTYQVTSGDIRITCYTYWSLITYRTIFFINM